MLRGRRTKTVFIAMNSVTWGVAPLLLVFGAYWFARQRELPITEAITAIALTLVPFSWAALFFFIKRRMSEAYSSIVAAVLCFSCLAFAWMLPGASATFSSKRWAEDYGHLTNHSEGALFLSSKMFVRGMAYYTGAKNMGVFSGQPKGGFYTPHPIPIFSNVKELMERGKLQFPIYFLIRRKELQHLREGLEPGFSVSVLEQSPVRILAKLDHV